VHEVRIGDFWAVFMLIIFLLGLIRTLYDSPLFVPKSLNSASEK